MAIALYMDVHIPRSITIELRLRGVDVITAQEDNKSELADSALLDRATELQRAFFTFDEDFLVEAKRRREGNIPFTGVIYARPLRVSIGTCTHDLELIASAADLEDMENHVEYLPL